MIERSRGSTDELVVASMTLARDAGEERELMRSVEALVSFGLPVVISDGGSPRSFLTAVEAMPNVLVVPPIAGGLVGQVATSLRTAREMGASRILYTEPDKRDFFASRLASFLDEAKDSASLVLAGRSAKSMATFPPMQRLTEGSINRIAAEITGVSGDYCYGPFLADALLFEGIEGIDMTLGWGWRFELFARTHHQGGHIVIIEDDHDCPFDQREESERDRLYRLSQLEQNVRGLLRGGS